MRDNSTPQVDLFLLNNMKMQEEILTCKSSGLISGNSPEMPQIALVAHQHDDNVVISMIPQLLQPALHILISQMLCDVIDQKSSNCTPVVSVKETYVKYILKMYILMSKVPTAIPFSTEIWMTTVYPSADGYFQQDNAPCHKAQIIPDSFLEHDKRVHFTQMSSSHQISIQ